MEYEFISITQTHDTGKTKVFDVTPKNSKDLLGKICWYSNWRRYTFMPTERTIFDSKCLANIISFIGHLMNERKVK